MSDKNYVDIERRNIRRAIKLLNHFANYSEGDPTCRLKIMTLTNYLLNDLRFKFGENIPYYNYKKKE